MKNIREQQARNCQCCQHSTICHKRIEKSEIGERHSLSDGIAYECELIINGVGVKIHLEGGDPQVEFRIRVGQRTCGTDLSVVVSNCLARILRDPRRDALRNM